MTRPIQVTWLFLVPSELREAKYRPSSHSTKILLIKKEIFHTLKKNMLDVP